MIYHFSAKYVKASKGKCAVASAAYQSAEELYDERLGETFSYKTKEEVTYSEILLPKNAPERLKDRQVLWNEVEKVNKNKNARYARQFEISLPKELTTEQNIELAHDYVQRNFVDLGMCADWAYHDKPGNPHMHLMVTMRGFKLDGTWAPNERKGYSLDKDGNRIPVIDPQTGKQKIGARNRRIWKRETQKLNDWDSLKRFYTWRKDWADSCNRYVRSIDPKVEEISHLSYRAQGIDKVPTIHEGYAARKMEQEGESSDRMEENRFRRKLNYIYEGIKEKIGIAHKQLSKIKIYIERRRLEYGSVRNDRTDRYAGGNAGNPDGLSGAGERYRRGSADREFEPATGTEGAGAERYDHRSIAADRERLSGLRERIAELSRRNREITEHYTRPAGDNLKAEKTKRTISELLSKAKRRRELRGNIEKYRIDGTGTAEGQTDRTVTEREQQIVRVTEIYTRYGGNEKFADYARQYTPQSEQRTKGSEQRAKRLEAIRGIVAGLNVYRDQIEQRKQQAKLRATTVKSKPEQGKTATKEQIKKEKTVSKRDPLAEWKKRRDAVEEEIKSLKTEIASIDAEFASAENQKLMRHQRIRELQQERDACGLMQGDKRSRLTEQIESIRKLPLSEIENQKQKTERRRHCKERIDVLTKQMGRLQNELTDIMSQRSNQEPQEVVKQDQTIQQKRKPTIRRKL